MKKVFLLLWIIFINFSTFSQQEVKLDIADAIGIKTIDISYEKYVADDTSVGLSLLIDLNDDDTSFRYNEDLMITPFVRHYFTTEYTWNFFGELFLGINSGKDESIEDSGIYDINYTDGALGVATGLKYESDGGFIVDVHLGIGRNLFNNNSPTLVPRLGAQVGWQF